MITVKKAANAAGKKDILFQSPAEADIHREVES